MAKDKDKLGNAGRSQGKSNGLGNKPRGGKPKLDAKNASGAEDRKPFAFENDPRPKMNRPRNERLAQPLNDMRLGELTIDRMGHDGRGISTWNGKTLFVKGAIAGERVTARLVEEHARYAEARLDQLIDASDNRVEPPCPHFSVCGGCQLQHMNPDYQLATKQQAMLEQLSRWGGVTPKQVLAPIVSPSLGYRRTARLSVWYADEGVRLGFRQSQSREVVDVRECSVLDPRLAALLNPLREFLSGLAESKAVTHIELFHADLTGVVLRHTKPLSETSLADLSSLAQQNNLAVWLQPSDDGQLFDLTGAAVDPRLSYSVNGLKIQFHPNDFIQVNATVNEQMVSKAIELLRLSGKERVLDLFCGVGNFTLPLAQQAKEVIGVEAVETMVQRGGENARLNNIHNAKFLAGDLTKMNLHRVKQLCGEVDAVLLDPPRDGAKDFMLVLTQLLPKRIVYVSCNPATLARDAKLLVDAGYKLDSAGAMDMFPHTEHVESIALFKRR